MIKLFDPGGISWAFWHEHQERELVKVIGPQTRLLKERVM